MALNPTKELIAAQPAVDESGNVKVWEVSVTYTLNDYSIKLLANVMVNTPSKKPEDYSKQELIDLVAKRLDARFEARYKREVLKEVPTAAPTTEFDINTLK